MWWPRGPVVECVVFWATWVALRAQTCCADPGQDKNWARGVDPPQPGAVCAQTHPNIPTSGCGAQVTETHELLLEALPQRIPGVVLLEFSGSTSVTSWVCADRETLSTRHLLALRKPK